MSNSYHQWQAYCARELATLTPLLQTLGFSLEQEQPHLQGERYLMHAVTTTSGKKLILLARRTSDDVRVVIKATSDAAGMCELRAEQERRRLLARIPFAYEAFPSPEQLVFTTKGPFLISIQRYIEQSPFLSRPLEEQFSLSLAALKAQEGARAATYEHHRTIARTFGRKNAQGYLASFDSFAKAAPSEQAAFTLARHLLADNTTTIDRYGDFLVHTDFVPHNFRVANNTVYLLDHSSLRFGNKYEGWARFINFMVLYNRPLADALLSYVRLNRSEGEQVSLRLMRLYRLGEITAYYATTVDKSEGDLQELNRVRRAFWGAMLSALAHGQELPEEDVARYRALRDALRSPEEKRRQQELH